MKVIVVIGGHETVIKSLLLIHWDISVRFSIHVENKVDIIHLQMVANKRRPLHNKFYVDRL